MSVKRLLERFHTGNQILNVLLGKKKEQNSRKFISNISVFLQGHIFQIRSKFISNNNFKQTYSYHSIYIYIIISYSSTKKFANRIN